VTSPYTDHPMDALLLAQTSVGITLTALLFARPQRTRLATLFLIVAVWLAVFIPKMGDFVAKPLAQDVLHKLNVTLESPVNVLALRASAVACGVAGLLTRRRRLAFAGVLGGVLLWWLRDTVTYSDWWVAAINLAFFGLLIGFWYRTPPATPGLEPTMPWRPLFLLDDVLLFAVGTALAAYVATKVLHRQTISGDEVANTYQAGTYWKLHAYDAVPPCEETFRSYWVWHYQGRAFAQYTPGWPMFMALFVPLRAIWLAAPCATGLLVVGVARLARRAAAGVPSGLKAPSRLEIRAAGVLGALAVCGSCLVLVNGGSRYPHIFVAATFAWSVELLLHVCDKTLRPRAQWLAGLLLGTVAALMISARPGDGATLGIGLFAYMVYAILRREVGLRAFVAATVAFALWGGLTLLILRLQLGVWFKTGYAISPEVYPWFKTSFSLPKPDEIRWGVPLDTGSYTWWPCAPAVALAGLASLRGKARGLWLIFFGSVVPFFTFYTMLDFGRGYDNGYGPRYSTPVIVPLAVGTGVILAQLVARVIEARPWWRILPRSVPLVMALGAWWYGIHGIAPLLYPGMDADVSKHSMLHRALEKQGLKNSIVIAHPGFPPSGGDLPENLPLDLYPDQDYLIAVQRQSNIEPCIREHFPTREVVHARAAGDEVTFAPK